jgi:hypothetical protein
MRVKTSRSSYNYSPYNQFCKCNHCSNKKSKCPYCPFYDRWMNRDKKTEEAKEMANERDILDINRVVDVNPLIDSSFI